MMFRLFIIVTGILILTAIGAFATNGTSSTSQDSLAIVVTETSVNETIDTGEFYFPTHTEAMTNASEADQPDHHACKCTGAFGGSATAMCTDAHDCACTSSLFGCMCECFLIANDRTE